MWRGFFSLYGAVILALVLSFFAVYLPLNWYIQKLIHSEVNQTASGIFKLVETEFSEAGETGEERVLHRMNRLFPYGINLLEREALDKLEFSDKAVSMIDSGKIGYLDGEPEALYKKLPGREKYLQINWSTTLQVDTEFQANGVLRLIEEHLEPLPGEEWPGAFREITSWFDIPISFKQESEASLKDDELEIINQGRLFTRILDDKNDKYQITGRIADSDYVFRAGPLNNELSVGNNLLLLVPAALTALAVFSWFWFLWRDVKKLNAATAKLGNGELSARAVIKKRSALKETAERFNRMAADIEQLIRGNRELTNAVSHDLKTPLSRMRFALEMLEHQNQNVESRRLTQSIEGDVSELEALVEELLANARYDRQLELQRKPVNNLGAWVESIVKHRHLQHSELKLEFDFSDIKIDKPILIDQKAMARALGNVIGNALIYADHVIHCSIKVNKKACEIAVSDDGPGINEANRERVLKPFTRLEQSRGPPGHGLGLAISNRILQQHEGTLMIKDSSLGGAMVVLRWPTRLADAALTIKTGEKS